MPDAVELLQTRRSIKPVELVGPPPSGAEIDTLLTIASRVPDHGKLVPWRFIVFEGEARLAAGDAIVAAFRAKYPQATGEQAAAERQRLARAPLGIPLGARAPALAPRALAPNERSGAFVHVGRPPGPPADRPPPPLGEIATRFAAK